MSAKPQALFAWGFMLIAVIIIGYLSIAYMGGYPPFKGPIGAVTTTTGVCPYGGTYPSGCNAAPTQIYSGTVSFLISAFWAQDQSALTLTSAGLKLYHADASFSGTATQGTATDINENPTDQGVMYFVYQDLTGTVGWVDPAATVKNNPAYITGYDVATDYNKDGINDIRFALNLKALTIAAGQTKPTVTINLVAWKDSTADTVTNISSPTGMTTAGDYHATGYMSMSGEGYEMKVSRIIIWVSHTNAANTTAGSLSTKFLAGTAYIPQFRFSGVGAQTSTTYGQTWTGLTGAYDSSNTRIVVFTANSGGVTDLTQTEWGAPYIYERASGSSWLTYDIWIHTASGALTASSVYYLYLEVIHTTPAGTQSSATSLKITLTG